MPKKTSPRLTAIAFASARKVFPTPSVAVQSAMELRGIPSAGTRYSGGSMSMVMMSGAMSENLSGTICFGVGVNGFSSKFIDTPWPLLMSDPRRRRYK